MLRAINRVLKPGGKLGFRTILSVETTSESDRAFLEMISPMVGAGAGYEVLLHEAGFVEVTITDITPDYALTVSKWIEAWEADQAAIIDVCGEEDYEERMSRRRNMLEAIDRGLLLRQLVLAIAPMT